MGHTSLSATAVAARYPKADYPERFAIASPGPRCDFEGLAAQRKINSYRQQYTDNQDISFLPVIVSTSTRMHGEFLRLLFLQAHRETEPYFTASGMSSQHNQSDSFHFKHVAFYQLLKSKV
jgi:hypothetical protein